MSALNEAARRRASALQPGTIYGCVIDRRQRLFGDASDPQYDTPVIPGTGLAISCARTASRASRPDIRA